MTSEKKEYLEEIAAIKDFYNPKANKKFTKNKRWHVDWKGFVEHTVPYDGASVFETIVYRLEVLRAYLTYYGHTELTAVQKEDLDDAIELGRKLINLDDYYDYANKLINERCKTIISICDKQTGCVLHKFEQRRDGGHDAITQAWLKAHNFCGNDVKICHEGKWDSERDHHYWCETVLAANRAVQQDREKFFAILARSLHEWVD